jgi:hypothetical protein
MSCAIDSDRDGSRKKYWLHILWHGHLTTELGVGHVETI